MIFDSITHSIDGHALLNGVYLKALAGEVTALLGLNGSGKSTLMRIAAGLILPNSGTIFCDGQPFNKRDMKKRYNKIAFLPQTSFLPKDITVKKLIKSFPNSSLADELFIQKHFEKKISMLSGGERRLLEFRLLISLNRAWYLLDEPFVGVEPIYVERLVGEMEALKKAGKGIIISDHQLHHFKDLVDSSYLLMHGRCTQLSSLEEYKDLVNTFHQ